MSRRHRQKGYVLKIVVATRPLQYGGDRPGTPGDQTAGIRAVQASADCGSPKCRSLRPGGEPQRINRYSPSLSTAMKAFWLISTLPIAFIRFLPSFCFCNSFRFRVMSPP
ncbi:hypothetical protein K227x_25470 [Rubripirellula lacrimiformis]|uniref:Uncharacterized protein n=1 Tax=Rubripirellula lacrimiformis TaxID=1930273 RepID=A0A517NAX0_9BACT|nr:hypothetical protein K227x_25470 [Rubripirellula lacrimiformis]